MLVLLMKAANPMSCAFGVWIILGSDRQHFNFLIFLSYGLKDVNHIGKKSNVFNLSGRMFGSFNCSIFILMNVIAIIIIGIPY